MLDQVNGLPAHILLVHAVVVLVPLTALLVVLSAVWPAARRRLGVLTPAAALVTFASIPLTTHSGEWLQARVPATALLREHTSMGDSIVPFGFGLLLLAAGGWWWARRQDRTATTAGRQPRVGAVGVAVAALSVLVAAGAVVQVARIGESGARAAWDGKVSSIPHAVPGGH